MPSDLPCKANLCPKLTPRWYIIFQYHKFQGLVLHERICHINSQHARKMQPRGLQGSNQLSCDNQCTRDSSQCYGEGVAKVLERERANHHVATTGGEVTDAEASEVDSFRIPRTHDIQDMKAGVDGHEQHMVSSSSQEVARLKRSAGGVCAPGVDGTGTARVVMVQLSDDGDCNTLYKGCSLMMRMLTGRVHSHSANLVSKARGGETRTAWGSVNGVAMGLHSFCGRRSMNGTSSHALQRYKLGEIRYVWARTFPPKDETEKPKEPRGNSVESLLGRRPREGETRQAAIAV